MVLSASRWLALTHPESNCDTRLGFMDFPFLLSIPQSCRRCPCVMPHPASQLQSNVKQLSHPYLPCSVSPVRKRSLMAKKEDSSSNPLQADPTFHAFSSANVLICWRWWTPLSRTNPSNVTLFTAGWSWTWHHARLLISKAFNFFILCS